MITEPHGNRSLALGLSNKKTPSIIIVTGAPVIFVTEEILTVSPTSIVILSPPAGTEPQDQVAGVFQLPFPRELQFAAFEFKENSTEVTNNVINFFIGLAITDYITKTFIIADWLAV